MYPNTRKGKHTQGFTMAELLVVVAIIAVLVAVAIPVFTASKDRAEEAVCMANRRSWYGMLTTESLLGELSAAEMAAGRVGYVSDNEEYKQFICPAGGTLSYTVNRDGSVEVGCSAHKTLVFDAGTVLSDRVNAVMDQLLSTGFTTGKHIDSYAQGVSLQGWYNTVKNGLPEGFSGGAPTWAILNGNMGMQYVWSTETLTLDDVGTQLPVICYNKNSETYSVGYAEVKQSNINQYPVIAKDVKAFTPSGVSGSGYTELEYEQAVIKYNALLEDYKAGK